MKHKIGHLISSSKYAGIEQHINELVSEFQNTDIKATIIADKKIKNAVMAIRATNSGSIR